MRIKIFVLILAVYAIACTSEALPSAAGFYLEEFLKEAAENNPDIRAAKKRWEIALVRTPDTALFDSRAPVSLKEKIAVIEAQMYACEYKDTQEAVLREAREAFFDLFLDTKETEVYGESLKLLEDLIGKDNSPQLSVEDRKKIDLEIKQVREGLSKLKEDRVSRQKRIEVLLHKKYAGAALLKDGLYAMPQAGVIQRQALENQLELIALFYVIEKNKFILSSVDHDFIPGFISEVSLKGMALGKIGAWDFILGAELPFWLWVKQRYGFTGAINNLQESWTAYETMLRNLSAEVAGIMRSLSLGQGQIKSYKESLLPEQYALFNAAYADYKGARGALRDLLEKERRLRETKIGYYKVLTEYNMNLSELELLIGGKLKGEQL